MKKTTRKAASKPTDFPLYEHPSGQWARRLKDPKTGKWNTFYFGKDRDKAIERWSKEKDSLFAGITPKSRQSDKPSLAELGNVFHEWQNSKMQNEGKPCRRHVEGCRQTIERLIGILGADCRIDTLTPLEWDAVKTKLFEPKPRKPAKGGTKPPDIARRSIVTVDGDVRRITLFVRWCEEKELVGPINLGGLKASSRKERRKQKAKSGKRNLSRETVLAILERSKPNYRPIVLLGINAGIGALDIASMTLGDVAKINDKHVWIELDRLKTGNSRRFELWPETRQAILDWLSIRPNVMKGYDPDTLFVTSHRIPWVRDRGSTHDDAVGGAFAKIRKACGIDRGSFYDLRRTFATVASETLDLEAIKFVMGFIPKSDDMLPGYVQAISDDRLKRVTDHVRDWLFGKPVKRGAK